MAKKRMHHEAQKGDFRSSTAEHARPSENADPPQDEALASDAVLEGGPGQQAEQGRPSSQTSLPQRSPDKADPSLAEQASEGRTVAADPLMQEVQSFLSRREALAQKLAAEIEATERKLAELKQTAADLFPQADETAGRDRRTKKNKPKTNHRSLRPEPPTGTEDRIPGGGG